MSNTQNAFDFERWMRNLLTGIKSVRRWKNKNIFSVSGFLGNKCNKLRAYLMIFVDFFVRLLGRISKIVDPWRTTQENVLEHSFKQAMIIQKIAAIEIYNGNPHRLDFYRLLQYAINHDLAESIVGDINYHDKIKNKGYLDAEERKAFFRIISEGVRERYSIHFAFPISLGRADNSAEMELWDLSEIIGYCYFMLEEILIGKISQQQKSNFFMDVSAHLITLEENEEKFASVKEILHKELLPKFYEARSLFK